MWLTPDGELTEIDHSSAAERVQKDVTHPVPYQIRRFP